jgi:ubiquinol-cytochrome c reductase cytochrome b/c1 subunit
MRDVINGWFLRYPQTTGESSFFFIFFLHLYTHDSDLIEKSSIETIGLVIFIVIMMTAFFGYLLPWGQMSFWATTVITGLIAVVPLYGQSLSYFIWGGYAVSNPTLNRFFSFHYLLPFLIISLVLLHLQLLHQTSSTSQTSNLDTVDFYPYFFLKDLALALLCIFLLILVNIFFIPIHSSHPDNNILADIVVTPLHLAPEWYFLPFYTVLRIFPDKVGGMIITLLTLSLVLDASEDGNNDDSDWFHSTIIGAFGSELLDDYSTYFL